MDKEYLIEQNDDFKLVFLANSVWAYAESKDSFDASCDLTIDKDQKRYRITVLYTIKDNIIEVEIDSEQLQAFSKAIGEDILIRAFELIMNKSIECLTHLKQYLEFYNGTKLFYVLKNTQKELLFDLLNIYIDEIEF